MPGAAGPQQISGFQGRVLPCLHPFGVTGFAGRVPCTVVIEMQDGEAAVLEGLGQKAVGRRHLLCFQVERRAQQHPASRQAAGRDVQPAEERTLAAPNHNGWDRVVTASLLRQSGRLRQSALPSPTPAHFLEDGSELRGTLFGIEFFDDFVPSSQAHFLPLLWRGCQPLEGGGQLSYVAWNDKQS